MAVELHDGTNGDGLFDILGKAFFAQKTLVTAAGTTVPTEILDALAQFKKKTSSTAVDGAEDPLPLAIAALSSSAIGVQTLIRQYCQDFLIRVVNADSPLPELSLRAALEELITQMVASGDDVDASTIGVTPAAGGSNTGNGTIVTSSKRGDGRVQENAIVETIDVFPQSEGFAVSLQFLAAISRDLLASDWPGGSGCNKAISAITPGGGLLTNGDFEDEDDVADAPDDWIVVTGTIGTTLKMTNVEVQTIAISGTPTTGHMLINWTDPSSNQYVSIPIGVSASAADVQAALRLFDGLEDVTVTVTGTAPNYTYTVTFNGAGGDVSQFTSTNRFDTGSITHGTTTSGSGQVFEGGKALEFDSDGSQQTQIRQRLFNLSPLTAYAVNLWARVDVVPAAGVITIDLVDGGLNVIQDAQGVNNSFTFNVADCVNSAWKTLDTLVSGDPVFRMPATVPDVVYIRLRASTAISNTTSLYLDGFQMAEMQELYPGGPMAAAFAGSKRFRTTDTFTVAVTNDRAGEFQEWFNRNYSMASLGLLLPSDTGGSETLADSLIA